MPISYRLLKKSKPHKVCINISRLQEIFNEIQFEMFVKTTSIKQQHLYGSFQ